MTDFVFIATVKIYSIISPCSMPRSEKYHYYVVREYDVIRTVIKTMTSEAQEFAQACQSLLTEGKKHMFVVQKQTDRDSFVGSHGEVARRFVGETCCLEQCVSPKLIYICCTFSIRKHIQGNI